MCKSIDRIAFEFWCGIGQINEFEEWVKNSKSVPAQFEYPFILFGLDENSVKKHSLNIAKELLNFEPLSSQGEEMAIVVLKEMCSELINETIKPIHFCKVVNFFDANFLDYKSSIDSAEYPVWLGDLWNCCDWCEESWTNSNSPELLKEAEKVLYENT